MDADQPMSQTTVSANVNLPTTTTDSEPASAVPPSAADIQISPLTRQLAAQFGLEPAACGLIERAAQAVGADALKAMAQQAREDAAEGGLSGIDGTHLLRPADLLIYGCYSAIPLAQRAALTPPPGHRPAPRPSAPPKPAPAEARPGAVSGPKPAVAKVTMIGRPTRIEQKKEHVALTLVTGPLPALPKGLPAAGGSMTITIFVGEKQWRKVADQIAGHPDDAVIVEGYLAPDGQGRTAVFGSSCTTRLLQQAVREKQAAAAAAAEKPA